MYNPWCSKAAQGAIYIMITAGLTQISIENARPKTQSSQRFYRPELDVLRFFAFLGVFFSHLKPHSIPPELLRHTAIPMLSSLVRLGDAALGAGNYGVDLFFVLSAYLITELLVREKVRRGSLDVKAFYVRRILRIWPLYFFFIGVACLLQVLIAGQVFSWQYVMAFLLLTGNWICALHGLPASVALPLWSVSIEEQFYLLWPQVVRRASARRLAVVAIGLLAMASAVRFVLLARHANMRMLGYSTFTRLDGIAIGILISLVLRGRVPSLSMRMRGVLVLLGFGLLVTASELLNPPTPGTAHTMLGGMLGYPLVGISCTLLFLSALGLPAERMRPVRWFRLVYLGKISYGLYVYHLLALLLVHMALSPLRMALHPLYALLGLALAVALSIASYQLLELPFLRLKERFTYVPSRPG
jgi:peptidoglycan/LPS O-acetylase OafA/YrhL